MGKTRVMQGTVCVKKHTEGSTPKPLVVPVYSPLLFWTWSLSSLYLLLL